MRRWAWTALGMMGLLAACDSFGSAPDGSAKGNIVETRTEYRLDSSAGIFVACDSVVYPDTTTSTKTQVAVKFNLQGTIQDIKVGLVGTKAGVFDPNFVQTITGTQLVSAGTNQFRVVFDADAGQGKLLPLSIVVTPAVKKVKIVSVSAASLGSFYAQLDVNTGTSVFSMKNQLVGTIPVYSQCTVNSTTTEDV